MGKVIVFCNCGGERISSERLQFIEESLRKFNAEIHILTDLCRLAAIGKESLAGVFSGDNEYLVIGCYERSLKLLLDQNNADYKRSTAGFINFLESADEEIFQKVSAFCKNSDQVNSWNETGISSDWISWYPVIDYSRCTACGQCADFCLFGVYEKGGDKVKVVNPQECKNNCPACARICPHTAIIFPKYRYGGAIGGSDLIDEAEEQKRQAVDVSNILNGDIYNALEQRKMKRQSIIRNEAMKKAIEERDNALNK